MSSDISFDDVISGTKSHVWPVGSQRVNDLDHLVKVNEKLFSATYMYIKANLTLNCIREHLILIGILSVSVHRFAKMVFVYPTVNILLLDNTEMMFLSPDWTE